MAPKDGGSCGKEKKCCGQALKENWLHYVVICVSTAAYINMLIWYILSQIPVGTFKNNTAQLTDEQSTSYKTLLTPPAWVHLANWIIILVYMLAYVIYSHSTVCRRVKGTDDLIAFSECGLSIYVHALLTVTFLLSMAWYFLWGLEYLWPACVFMFLLCIVSILALVFTVKNYTTLALFYRKYAMKLEPPLRIIFVHNGIAAIIGWVVPMFLINLSVCLVHGATDSIMDDEASAILILSVWLVIVLVYCPIEWIFLRRHMTGVNMHYTTMQMVIIGLFQKALRREPRFDSAVSILTLILFILIIVFHIVKHLMGGCAKKDWKCNKIEDCDDCEDRSS